MNKKGADKIMSAYWFAMLFIVAAAIVYMVITFYGQPYDVREMEAEILIDQIADCLDKVGDVSQLSQDNFLQVCGLNFNVEDSYDWNKQGQYYLEINFYDYQTNGDLLSPIKVGNFNLKDACSFSNGDSVVCISKNFYVVNTDQEINVKIFSIIRKTEKNDL